MEKLFAALIPVLCVMALGPFCCQAAGKIGGRKPPQLLDTGNGASDRESSL